MYGNRSVATIDAPQFINLEQDAINPGISSCEIKVLYLGKNRNGSFITKDVAIQMANSLPGTPIVGAYRKEIEDFGDHGEVIRIEDGEIEFSCKTIPYGFVQPDAQVWFQNFTDTDEFGNETEREYLMTTGYLWTGQYPVLNDIFTQGKCQSMELDPTKMDGHWATDDNEGIDFFIINDAVFTKLCILGDDVEPCFEGAAVTSPEVSKKFSKDAAFSQTLYTMLNELKFALNTEGGSVMPENVEDQVVAEETEVVETPTEEVVEETETVEEAPADNFTEESVTEEEPAAEFTEEEPAAEEVVEETEVEEVTEETPETSEVSLEEYAAIKAELEELKAYKLEQENLQKDALINKYFMLDDEDKKDVIANKEQYSLAEIESKLALIYVQKNVDFSTLDGSAEEVVVEESEEDPISTFSLDSEPTGIVSPLVASLRETTEN